MSALTTTPIGWTFVVPCPKDAEIVFGNFTISLEGLADGVQPWLGTGVDHPSYDPRYQEAKIILTNENGQNNVLSYEEGPITDFESSILRGCPQVTLCSCALPHTSGSPSTPNQGQGLYQIQPEGLSYLFSVDFFVLDPTTQKYVKGGTCTKKTHLPWRQDNLPRINGCRPIGKIPAIPAEPVPLP